MLSFLRFRGFSFNIIMRQKPKEVTRMLSLCLVIQRGMLVTPLDFWLRVIVKEKPPYLKSSICIVSNLWDKYCPSFISTVLDNTRSKTNKKCLSWRH